MSTIDELMALVQRLAAEIPEMSLDGDQQEEYSALLLRLQNTVATGEPNQRIVDECLTYLKGTQTSAA